MNKLLFIGLFVFTSVLPSRAQDDIYEVCRSGSLEQIQAIYKQNKALIDTQNNKGYLPITLACYHGNTEVVEFLADKVKNIDGNSNYGTPLMAAVFKKDKNIVKILLDNNADPNIIDSNGTTAMHYATMFQNYDIVKLLIGAKADFTIKDNTGKSAIDFAIAYNDSVLKDLLNIK